MNAPTALQPRPGFSLSRALPRNLSLLVGLLCAGAAIGYSISNETPRGRLHGRVILSDTGKPFANARITLTPAYDERYRERYEVPPGMPRDGGGTRLIRARTNANGEFAIAGLAAGDYHISAASRAHSVYEANVAIEENETTELPLKLNRSQPDLLLSQQQQTFLPDEKISLPVHGYVDGAKPAEQDTVRVRIFRTRLADVLRDPKATKALNRVADRYSPAYGLPQALIKPTGTVAPQLISDKTPRITEADVEGFFHKRIKLELPGAGLYLVDVAHGKSRVSAQLTVSDTALIVKKAPGTVLAYAVDSVSGAARPGADIQVLRAGKILARAKADAQGLARLTIPQVNSGESGGSLLTLASYNGNEATVGQYDAGQEDESNGRFTAHAYTDRPIYRPGGRVSYKGILRRTLDSGLRYAVPVNEPVAVEVRDQAGARVASAQLKTNRYGSFHGGLDLSPEAPTGSYSIVMTVQGEEHTSDFTVASYRKPEFSATIKPGAKHYAFNDKAEMLIDATYYFGAPVAGGKVRYTIMRTPDWRSLYAEEESSEDFDNPADYDTEEYYEGGGAEIVSEGETSLDQNGHAVIAFTPTGQERQENENSEESKPNYDEPQDQIYSVQATIIDSSTREVEAGGQVIVTAGDFRLNLQSEGYFALPNKPTTVTVTAKDFDGKAIAIVPIALNSFYRKWNSEKKILENIPAQNYRATTGADGSAKIEVTPEREGTLYLEARATDSRRRTILAKYSLWISGEQGGDYDAQYNTLSLLTDKKRYAPGETARVLINSERSGGTALLTLEGSKLFRSWLVPLAHRSTALRVPLATDYGPNVTLAACMVRDKKFAQSQAPLRIDMPQRAIKVAITSDRQAYKPGDKITYQLLTTDFKGKPVPSELSFGVVDESIYALQEDNPTALRLAFYPPSPNSVRTSYSFEPLYLGDVNKANPVIEARRKFLDTAFWQPDVQTDTNGRATVSFTLPDNLTAWRATAVAQTLDTAFGRRTQKVTVAKDFFVRLETPRFFTSGDSTQLIALVHNDTGKAQRATVKLQATGVKLGGPDTQQLQIAAGAVGQIVWPVSLDSMGLGISQQQAAFELSSWTDKVDGPQFTDAIESKVPIRPRGTERIQNFVGSVNSGDTVSHVLPIDTAAIPAANSLTIRITPSVSAALLGPLRYLVGYPYGCTEQTMSRFLPDILVQRTLRQQGASDKDAARLNKEIPLMVRDGLTRLARFQHNSGAWGWWEQDEDEPWMTAYVLYGLSHARAAGYDVNDEMLARGRAAGITLLTLDKKKIQPWQRKNWKNTHAFLLYALACASPTPKEATQLRSERLTMKLANLGPQALAYLSLFDQKMNLGIEAQSALEAKLTTGAGQMRFWKGSDNDEWSDWNAKTATAAGLKALIARNPRDKRIPSILLWLMTRRQDDAWGSTRDTAWVLDALSSYLNTVVSAGTGLEQNISVKLNGEELANYKPTAGENSNEYILRVPWQRLRGQENKIAVQRSGSGQPVFYTVQLRQTIGSDGPLTATSSNPALKVTREYRRVVARPAGNSNWALQSEATNNQLRQGDRIRVRLTFEVPGPLSYVIIEDAFPAGCEATERGSVGVQGENWENWWSSTDVRDDRIAFFARSLSKGKHTIEYNLRGQTPGSYNALPTMLQAMYAPEVRALSAEDRLTIGTG